LAHARPRLAEHQPIGAAFTSPAADEVRLPAGPVRTRPLADLKRCCRHATADVRASDGCAEGHESSDGDTPLSKRLPKKRCARRPIYSRRVSARCPTGDGAAGGSPAKPRICRYFRSGWWDSKPRPSAWQAERRV